jgi:hypothetical protein
VSALRAERPLTALTAFDAKPFIRAFEDAVDRLISIRNDVQTKTEQLEKSVRVTEREYSKKMNDLSREFEVGIQPKTLISLILICQAVGQSFTSMESKMNEVSRTAIRIGYLRPSVLCFRLNNFNRGAT